MPDERTTLSERVRQVVVDMETDRSLWHDPASYGRKLGLSGAELAELVGVIRYSNSRRQLSTKHRIVVKAAVLAEMGRPWPFEDQQDSDLGQFVEATDVISEFVLRTKAKGINLDDSVRTYFRSWATALLRFACHRASTQDVVNPHVADAIVASRHLLSACELLNE